MAKMELVLYWWMVSAYLVSLTMSEFTLTILHTGDVHANIEQFDKYAGPCSEEEAAELECFGGVARMMTKIHEIRDSRQNVLLLDAGDMFRGTIWFYYYKGMAIKYFMEQLGYNAMVSWLLSSRYCGCGICYFVKYDGT